MASIETRTNTEGDTTYRVKIRLKGYPTQTASFQRLTDARKWVQDTESAIRDGRHFKTSEAKRHSFQEMIDRYIKDVLPRKSDSAEFVKSQASQLRWWAGELGAYTLADITPARIVECRDALISKPSKYNKPLSNSTVVRYMAALSHCYSIAVREWGWIDDNPMRKVTKPREPRGRVRYLSDGERASLLKACAESDHPYLSTIVILALSTGMRKSEITTLKWPNVNLSSEYLILHQTKNGERRRVPLTGLALEQVKQLGKVRRIDTPLLFPSLEGSKPDKPCNIRKAWDAALKAAEIEDFRFHDLRHSAASYLAMNGASLAEIAEVLGHKTLSMVKRYAHLSEAHTSKVVASMNERIFG